MRRFTFVSIQIEFQRDAILNLDRRSSPTSPVWPVKSRQISKRVAQKWFHYESCPKIISLSKFTKNVGSLAKIIVAKGFEKLPKVQ